MNILIVSTYPPMNCGIGKYASQQVEALRREGHRVDVLSPAEGEGEFQEHLYGGWRPLRLLKYLWAYDEAYIHFTPQFFYNSLRRADRICTSLAFLLVMLLAGRRVSFLIHETSFRMGQTGRGPLRHRIERWQWRLARRVIFHTQRERQAFADFYNLHRALPRFELWPHQKYFAPRCDADRPEARRRLGIEPDVLLFLCIGFIQPHKGFDRAIEAFRRVPDPRLRLRVVGSVRLAWDQVHIYARRLHELADADPRCEVLEGYLSDELFDLWIVAADYLVLPYHELWTSGVAARGALYGRPIIAARTGAVDEQLTEGSYSFSTDAELVEILSKISESQRIAVAKN